MAEAAWPKQQVAARLSRAAQLVVAGGQWIWRTKPQMWQRATPDGSSSRKLVQPLVLQYRREDTFARRRRRRIAVARPVTDAVVERDIMVLCLSFLARQ
jgi:hypothetical protein